MPFQTAGEIRYFNFEALFRHAIRHGIFTREGGVSTGPLKSLNVGSTVGDDPANVAENRRRSFASLEIDPGSVHEVWQVHSAAVQVVDSPRQPDWPYRQADAMVTGTPGVALYMRFADCVPVLLSDPVAGVVGLVHAGWLGTVRGASSAAVKTMVAEYGCHPQNVVAGIGPSIGPDHYEVGPDVVAQVQAAFGTEARDLIHQKAGKSFFNLWQANAIQLQEVGIGQIELAGICTGCHLTDWYSHRLENGRTGRFGALIVLQ